MSFREKSAWAMAALLTLTGGLFVKLAVFDGVPAVFAAFPFVLFTVVGAFVVQLALVVLNIADANVSADERERTILSRSGHLSSYFLGVGVLLGLGYFMVSHDGHMMFFIILLTLIVAQIAEYGAQVLLFRRGA